VTSVLENTSVIEQRLRNHRDVVARLFQDQHRATIQEEVPERAVPQDNPPDETFSGAWASKEETLAGRNQPPTLTDGHGPSSGQRTQLNNNKLRGSGLARGSVAGNSPISSNRAESFRADFIQLLIK
jgi:hypothetical protein